MKKFLSILCATCVGLATNTHAESLYLAGASGVLDHTDWLCFEASRLTGEMFLTGGAYCGAAYSIDLPAGKVIDGVEVAYSVDSFLGPPNITATLMQNMITPYGGTKALATRSFSPGGSGRGTFALPIKKFSLVDVGSIYWIDVSVTDVQRISYVEVSYH